MDQLPRQLDALVVGGGPAGLSAALWLGRHRRRTLVVDAGEHRNQRSERIHGVLGHEGIAPGELIARARDDLAAYGDHVTLAPGAVTDLRSEGEGFVAEIDHAHEVAAARLVLATGVRDAVPDVAGIDEHYGADVFHCPTCDGFDACERDVAVIGWGQHVPAFAAELYDWAHSVCIVTDADDPDITPEQRRRLAERGIGFVEGEVVELVGRRGDLESLRLADGTAVPASMAFFSLKHHPTTRLAEGLGCETTGDGRLRVDEHALTTVPGVYAAGDVTPGMELVAVAAAQGTIAGVSCATSLHGHDTAPQAPQPAPDPRELAPQHVPDADG